MPSLTLSLANVTFAPLFVVFLLLLARTPVPTASFPLCRHPSRQSPLRMALCLLHWRSAYIRVQLSGRFLVECQNQQCIQSIRPCDKMDRQGSVGDADIDGQGAAMYVLLLKIQSPSHGLAVCASSHVASAVNRLSCGCDHRTLLSVMRASASRVTMNTASRL